GGQFPEFGVPPLGGQFPGVTCCWGKGHLVLGVDNLPTGIVIQDSGYERGMNPVSASLCFDSSKQWQPEQSKVSDDVDDLMPYEFVSEPQAVLVHQAAL